jgi:hypothetical protein
LDQYLDIDRFQSVLGAGKIEQVPDVPLARSTWVKISCSILIFCSSE